MIIVWVLGAVLAPMPVATGLAASGVARDFETLIRRHIDGGRRTMAAQVLIDARRNDPAYRPPYADAYLPLATELRATGRPEIAIRLCNGFHKRFPGHGDIPALYELIASIYSEDLGKPDYACRIRNFLQHQNH